MKKIIIISLFAAAAVAAASCTKEQTSVSETRIPASFTATCASSTKMTIDALKTSWEAGDAVSVFDLESKSEGKFTASSAGSKVVFNGSVSSDESILMYAIYPSNDAATCTEGAIKTTIPWQQNGTISTALAYGTGDGENNFTFTNVSSVIKFTIPESEKDILSVSFVADSLQVIAGDVEVSQTSATASEAADAKKYSTVMIKNADGTPLTPGDKYMTVIPGKYTGTLVFAKKDGATRYAAAKPVSVREYKADRIKNFGEAKLNWIKGAGCGVFTANVSPKNEIDKKVLLAQGNIQYDQTTNAWRISTDLKGKMTYTPDTDWIDYFYFCNADTPTSHQNWDAKLVWSDNGDWSKKLDQEGWSIWTQVEANFISPMDGTNNNREKFGIVAQSNGTCKDAAGTQYVVLYPDGYPGDFLAKDGYNSVVKTENELRALEDLGCAIIPCNGDYDWRTSSTHSGVVGNKNKIGEYWTCTPKTTANGQANILRFIFNTATPQIKTSGVWDAGANVRPMYEIK